MVKILYTLGIWVYYLLNILLYPFNIKAKKRILGLQLNKKKLYSGLQDVSQKKLLIHCASLGEFEQAKPIIEWILNHTDYFVVVSFFSSSGFDHAEITSTRMIKCYLPFDLPSKQDAFITAINPDKVIIIKNEWWWNLIHLLKSKNIPSYLVSSTIRDSHYFIKHPFSYFKNALESFDHVFTIDKISKSILTSKYKVDTSISGDTRVDQVIATKKSTKELQITNAKVIIYGSVWSSDLPVIKELIRLCPGYIHVIYPHELTKSNISLFQDSLRASEIISDISKISAIEVYINESMGQLKSDYKHAYFSYIGGGFGDGVHNILEALVYMHPIIIGPNHTKSSEAVELLAQKCLFTTDQLKHMESILELLEDEENRKTIESKLKAYFSPSNSATTIICQKIFHSEN